MTGTATVADGDYCVVTGGTHKGKSGIVEDSKTSKTGHVTITVRQADGVRSGKGVLRARAIMAARPRPAPTRTAVRTPIRPAAAAADVRAAARPASPGIAPNADSGEGHDPVGYGRHC